MTELATVQNLTTGPVLITPEGKVLEAGGYEPAVPVRTEYVRDLIRAGRIGIVTEAPTKDSEVDGAYGAAQHTTEQRRAEQAAEKAQDDARPAAQPSTTTRRAQRDTTAQEG